MTNIIYGVPTGVAATSNVVFGYDEAGNRTSMSDGLGSVSYAYNTLSQMTSETRNFNSLGSSYTLGYGYNLAGELTSLTNPFGVVVSYNYDATGRPISVSGSNYAGVTSYVNSIAYRAFGMKQMAYANGRTLSLGYDNRMRLASWDIPGVMGWSYAYNTPSIHENTQRVAFANNLYDHTLDRSYDYDAVGRMWASHSGAEGRAHAGYEAWGAVDGPYAENYSFDQLGNMTWRNGWGVANAQYNYAPAFVNNKMTVNPVTGAGVGYDASGNLTNDGSQSYSYDATGHQTYASGSGGGGAPAFSAPDPLVAGVTEVKAVHVTELRTAINQVRAGVGLAAYSWTYSVTTNDWITANPILEMRTALDQALGAPPSPGYAAGLAQGQPILAIHIQELRERVKTALGSSALSQSYDGDRLRGKKSEYGATTFYVRSSVLGGQVIAELGASGNWAKGYVYLGGQMLAIQNGAVNWVHQDPVTKSQRITNSSGALVSAIDMDPWGGETNRSANSAFQPHKYTSYERDGNGGDDAMHRRYQSGWTRFSQPDPYDGSYSLTNPQSLNRYSYVQNDPVNFVDPSGLFAPPEHSPGESFDPSKCYTLYIDGIQVGTIGSCGGGGSGGGGDTGGGGGDGPHKTNDPTSVFKKFLTQKPDCAKKVQQAGDKLGLGSYVKTPFKITDTLPVYDQPGVIPGQIDPNLSTPRNYFDAHPGWAATTLFDPQGNRAGTFLGEPYHIYWIDNPAYMGPGSPVFVSRSRGQLSRQLILFDESLHNYFHMGHTELGNALGVAFQGKDINAAHGT